MPKNTDSNFWINVDYARKTLGNGTIYPKREDLIPALEQLTQTNISSSTFSNWQSCERIRPPDKYWPFFRHLLNVDNVHDLFLPPKDFEIKYDATPRSLTWNRIKSRATLIGAECFKVDELNNPVLTQPSINRGVFIPVNGTVPPPTVTRLRADGTTYAIKIHLRDLLNKDLTGRELIKANPVYFLVLSENLNQNDPVSIIPTGQGKSDGQSGFNFVENKGPLLGEYEVSFQLKTDNQMIPADIFVVCSQNPFPRDVVNDLCKSHNFRITSPAYEVFAARAFNQLAEFLLSPSMNNLWKVFHRTLEFHNS